MLRLRINATVEDLELNKPTASSAPYKWSDVGWYDRGPRPGAIGHAVIYGHLDSLCCPAVFYRLKDLHPGDVVRIDYKKTACASKSCGRSRFRT